MLRTLGRLFVAPARVALKAGWSALKELREQANLELSLAGEVAPGMEIKISTRICGRDASTVHAQSDPPAASIEAPSEPLGLPGSEDSVPAVASPFAAMAAEHSMGISDAEEQAQGPPQGHAITTGNAPGVGDATAGGSIRFAPLAAPPMSSQELACPVTPASEHPDFSQCPVHEPHMLHDGDTSTPRNGSTPRGAPVVGSQQQDLSPCIAQGRHDGSGLARDGADVTRALQDCHASLQGYVSVHGDDKKQLPSSQLCKENVHVPSIASPAPEPSLRGPLSISPSPSRSSGTASPTQWPLPHSSTTPSPVLTCPLQPPAPSPTASQIPALHVAAVMHSASSAELDHALGAGEEGNSPPHSPAGSIEDPLIAVTAAIEKPDARESHDGDDGMTLRTPRLNSLHPANTDLPGGDNTTSPCLPSCSPEGSGGTRSPEMLLVQLCGPLQHPFSTPRAMHPHLFDYPLDDNAPGAVHASTNPSLSPGGLSGGMDLPSPDGGHDMAVLNPGRYHTEVLPPTSQDSSASGHDASLAEQSARLQTPTQSSAPYIVYPTLQELREQRRRARSAHAWAARDVLMTNLEALEATWERRNMLLLAGLAPIAEGEHEGLDSPPQHVAKGPHPWQASTPSAPSPHSPAGTKTSSSSSAASQPCSSGSANGSDGRNIAGDEEFIPALHSPTKVPQGHAEERLLARWLASPTKGAADPTGASNEELQRAPKADKALVCARELDSLQALHASLMGKLDSMTPRSRPRAAPIRASCTARAHSHAASSRSSGAHSVPMPSH